MIKDKFCILLRIFSLFFFAVFLFLGCNGNKGRISASGTIEATEINVSSKVTGELKQLLINEGSAVKQGDVLAVIDHSTFDLQLAQADAGFELADAQLKLLLNGARSEDVQQVEEGLKQAESNLKSAEDDQKRMQELYQAGTIGLKQKNDAEARYISALAQFNSAKQAFKKIQQWARPEEIKSAQARVNQAKAASDILKKTVSDCNITAPVNGVITNKPVEVGELVVQGSTVVTISKLDKVYLMIYVTEVELGRVKLGQQGVIKIDSAPKQTFTGRVIYISPSAEFTPKNVQTKEDRVKLVFGVKIEIDNSEGVLKSGMPADTVINTAIKN